MEYISSKEKLLQEVKRNSKALEEDDELRRKLLKKAEINTIGTTRKKIVALTTNLYPVDGVEYESFNESDDEEEDDE